MCGTVATGERGTTGRKRLRREGLLGQHSGSRVKSTVDQRHFLEFLKGLVAAFVWPVDVDGIDVATMLFRRCWGALPFSRSVGLG
jgi:hypothetical protein